MPTTKLSQRFVDAATCPQGKQKIDYFDTDLTGLVLKVMPTGKRTYYLRYKNPYGRQMERRLLNAAVVNLKQARERAKQYLSQLELGTDPFATQQARREIPTLAAFIADSYLPHIKVNKKSWKVDEAMFRLHILPRLGKLHLDEISKKHMVDLTSAHSQLHKPGSTNRMISVAHRMFECALKWELPGIASNPMAAVEKRKENNHRTRYLSAGELKALWAAIQHSDSSELPYIIRMLVFTGARKTEVLQAQWQHIDWRQCQWRIPENKSGRARYVPLSDHLMTMLGHLRHEKNGNYIFENPKTRKPYVNIYHSWNTARKEAGIPDFRLHDLRHTAASYMVNNGVSLYDVKAILGHSNFATTQRYAHLSDDKLRDSSNILAKHLGASIAPLVGENFAVESFQHGNIS